jgi:hypothetical protein
VLLWPADPALNYTIQFKDIPTYPAWLDLPGSATIIANRAYFDVPTDQPSRFYRVMAAP